MLENILNYIEQAKRTECKYDDVKIPPLDEIIEACFKADVIKALCFYKQNKKPEGFRCRKTHFSIRDKRLIHCALGLISEGGEILKAVLEDIDVREDIDVEEEIGDAAWYLAIGLDEVGIDVLYRNIEKLKKRYPKAFSRDDAVIRRDK